MKLFKRTFIFPFSMEGKRTSICMASTLILVTIGLVLASIASAGAVHAQSNTAKNSTTTSNKAPISTGVGNAANTTSKTQNQSKSSSNHICNIPLIRRLCKL